MTHLDEGLLRRAHDEPLVLSAEARAHLASCAECRARADVIAADAETIGALFAAPLPSVDVGAARAQFQPRRSLVRLPRVRLPIAAAVAAALAVVIAVTPANSLAQKFLQLFQPSQVVALPVTAQELHTLSKLSRYGKVHISTEPTAQAASSLADAAQKSGMAVASPSSLPAGVPSQATYEVLSPATSSFTFSAAKAEKWAQKRHVSLPAMPAGLDGSTLTVTSGSGVVTMYGKSQTIPPLVIGQMQAPTVSSTGASVNTMENYVLSLPGVSPQLAQAIRSVGDPTSVLPIPIPQNMTQSQSVTVQGVPGVAISDNTGMVTAVVWEKHDIIYGVGGTISQAQVMTIANSLS